MNEEKNTVGGGSVAKFVILSLLGLFLFLAPIPDGQGAFNIPLGIAINELNGLFGQVSLGTYAPDATDGTLGLHYLLALIAITVSFVGTVVAYLFKPGFIMDNPKLKALFRCSPVYFVSKAVAVVVIWMFFMGVGPDFIVNAWTGDVILGLAAGLMTIFLILIPAMPFVTEFGLMEFIGICIRKAVRFLFTLPGRASVDLMASWFGSSAASVIITRGQHERGFYTGREAAVIAVNFSFVSLPFTFVIARTIDLQAHFLLFYAAIAITCVILALILPRIWPLRNLPDTYLEEVGKQIKEDVPENTSTVKWAFDQASQRASKSSAKSVVESGASSYLNIFMDLIPVIMAWGTIAIILVEFTPIFTWISYPLGLYLQLLGVEGAMDVAPTALVGFIDMFLPALMLGGATIETRFILGALSIVQIIYLAETGVLIIKSKMPLGIGKLFIIFLMRTILGLPIIVLFARLFFNP